LCVHFKILIITFFKFKIINVGAQDNIILTFKLSTILHLLLNIKNTTRNRTNLYEPPDSHLLSRFLTRLLVVNIKAILYIRTNEFAEKAV